MASEKTMYWMAVGILALSATNGLVSEYRGWAGRVADRSIAMAEQVAGIAPGYANWAKPSRQDDDLKQLMCAQVRLARAQSTLAHRRAEIARVQIEGIRARVMAHEIRAVVDLPNIERPNIDWENQNFVVDVPEPPQVSVGDTF
jgi:hypothetical protein